MSMNTEEHLLTPGSSAAGGPVGSSQEDAAASRKVITLILVILIVLVLTIIGAVVLLLRPSTDTARIRDIFIIFMAVESLVIGLALVILMIQMARLINLLQNEVKPILESTNETVSNLRGTTVFLSDNLVEPVIKLNEYIAGLNQVLKTVGLFRNSPKK